MGVGALVLALGLGWAVPGPQRLICPTCFGLKQLEARVYVDALGRTMTTRNVCEA